MGADSLTRTASTLGGALVTTAETVVATLQIPSTGPNLSNITLEGSVSLTTGASTTGVTLRIRRASLTGTVISGPQADAIFAPAAAASETHSIQGQDALGDTAGQVYVLTAQAVAATGNASAVNGVLTATLSI